LVLSDIDPNAPDRLFPDTNSLLGKAWSVTITKVTAAVDQTDSLPSETVGLLPDNTIFLSSGAEIGSAAQLAQSAINSQQVFDKMNLESDPEHEFLVLEWENPTAKSDRLCLQKVDPLILRPITKLIVIAKCQVTVDEFPLRHGRYGNILVAWGKGSFLGEPVMLVATEGESSPAKMSIKKLPCELGPHG